MGRWNYKSPLHAIKRGLTSLFVCAVVLAPLFLLGNQARVALGLGVSDSRKATPLQALQVRAIDKGGPAIHPFQQPLITLTFDDGWESIYTQAMPLLQQYGIPTTQYILSGVEDDKGYMSFAQVEQMVKGGHEIGCHSVSHPDLTTISQSELQKQLRDCRKTLEAKLAGYKPKAQSQVQDFASPYGHNNQATIDAIKQVFRSSRNTDGDITTNQADDNDINVLATFNRYDITAITIRKETTQAQLQAAIDYTLLHNGWLVLNYHQVENGDDEYGIDMDTFENQLKAIGQAKARIVTMGQALDSLPAGK